MDYLQTTGDRLHDLELDRILARLRNLEAAAGGNATTTPPTVQPAPVIAAGVRSITPGSGTLVSDDIRFASMGSIALSQSPQTITFTVPVLVAGANITLTPVGNNITIAASGGGSALPTNVLTISPGSGGSYSWAVPSSLTEFKASIIFRAQHDLTDATEARLVLIVDAPVSTPVDLPTLAVQYSTNNGSTWAYLDGSTGPNLTWASGETASAWIALTGGAKADVLLRVVASGGNGSTSISFGSLYVQAK